MNQITSSKNLANDLTKPLGSTPILKFWDRIGLLPAKSNSPGSSSQPVESTTGTEGRGHVVALLVSGLQLIIFFHSNQNQNQSPV